MKEAARPATSKGLSSYPGGAGVDDRRREANLAVEARNIVESQNRYSTNTVPVGEVVAPQPSQLYKPPSFLEKVVEREQLTELNDLLAEMHRVNEENVGWDTREAEVFLNLSGQSQALRERLQSWTHHYLLRRLDPANVNPKDQGDSFLKFERLLGEYDKIFAQLSGLPASLNYLFLEWSGRYAAWLLFEQTWRDRLIIVGDTISLKYHPSRPSVLKQSEGYLCRFHWLDDAIGVFADGLVASGADTSGLESKTRESMLRRLATAVEDIQEMRPFLVRNFRTEKTGVPFGNFVLHWQWCSSFGIGWVFLADQQRDVFEFSQTGRSRRMATVNLDGFLRDLHLPWLGLPDRIGSRRAASLPFNVCVLELMRDKLLEFYDQIDFGRFRAAQAGEAWDDEPAEHALATSCQELARTESDDTDAVEGADTADEESPQEPSGRLRSVRQRQLLNVLQRHFECEVRQGKGSEITVYRRGAKKFVLGGHRRNPAVSSHLIKLLLQRLGITPKQWFTELS